MAQLGDFTTDLGELSAQALQSRQALTDAKVAALRQYPRLQAFGPYSVQYGEAPKGAEERYLEFYPPWESENPNPNISTIVVYPRATRDSDLASMIAGDMMHLLGAVDPRTGQPVDPEFYALKQRFGGTFTPAQEEMNKRAYATEGSGRRFEDYLVQSRLDAYLRGYIMHQWPTDLYTEDQRQLLEQMRRLMLAKKK